MIVVGVDGSLTARAAVDWAAGDAFRSHVPLRIVYAVDRSPYQIDRFPASGVSDTLVREGHRVLREAVALARERQPAVEVQTQDIEGAPAAVLREQAEHASEVVVGSRGLGGFAGTLLGSVSAHVAGQAPCPVVVVRGERRPRQGRIVVGVDDSPACEPALAYAFRQADLRGSKLRVVHAFAPEIARDLDEVRANQHRAVQRRLEAFRRGYPDVEVSEDIKFASPVEALTEASAEADLVVVGSHGRGPLGAALLGSVSRGVLHHARCTVAVVRAPQAGVPAQRT
ncbi:universal stress protein [Actinomadura sp. ATCC 31491]|uniref:Universal stress protein n=1 Tax=Actinomadura luzonensis TaxID=2805427 RepID=A0ABT0FY96_9ACTN|nr:universal stress protein [Actinomadura luzonensis]MCK2217326.1 universal stress protein [Actinomadura luzonensis]